MFDSIIDSVTGITAASAAECCLASIVLGLLIAFIYMKTSEYTKNFLISLAVLPVLVQIVIMMVDGNLGTSVAVLGAFSLVRFRSIPGTSKEIIAIFFAMAVGLATGMGCIGFAALFVVIVGAVFIILSVSPFGEKRGERRDLKITIPENLDYHGSFDDIFDKYLNKVSLDQVKTTNMGSMYELVYNVELKKDINEKNMMDEIRCRNGNLTVLLRRQKIGKDEL